MSTRKEKKQRQDEPAPRATRRRIFLALAAVFAALGIAAVVFMLGGKQDVETKLPPTASAIKPASPMASTSSDFQRLKGKWLRPDGGYIIAITSIETSGKMQAGYYNPNPINVSKAEAALEGETVAIFIELNDVGYPGSTYTLRYDPANDQLQGIYYQAAMQQSFEVMFVRQK